MAVGILSIGMLFIAGTFPTGLYLSTVAAERSIATVAADEAFAKIKLYDFKHESDSAWITPLGYTCVDFRNVSLVSLMSDDDEFAYPSTYEGKTQKKYYWRALCRRIDATDVQVTVFVCRRSGTGLWRYPVDIAVTVVSNNELAIDNPWQKSFINDGYTIVDSQTGQIYRVLERYSGASDNVICLDRRRGGPLPGSWVWVVRPLDGGRNPCIGVFQKVIRF